jgi:hypothetical protein
MKNCIKAMKNRIILIGFILSVGILISCKKDNDKAADFRDKYVGKYQVVEKRDSYGAIGNIHTVRDTVIEVDFGYSDSTLLVLGREVKLDSTGYYSAYHYGLRMWDDSIWSMYMNGGLGGGVYENYKGHKL